MNKKLFVLLPAALLLAACGPQKTPSSSGSEQPTTTDTGTSGSESSTSEDPAKLYGTAEAPLTVAEYNANVASLVAAENGTYSEQPFFVKGIASGNAVNDGTKFGNIFLKDNLSDSKSLKVQNAKPAGTVTKDPVGTHDELIVTGYAEYYNNYYNLYGGADGYANPSILSLTRGESAFTITKDENANLTEVKVGETALEGLTGNALNGTVVSFGVAAAEGFRVASVKCNGATVEAADGKYSCTVMGDTAIVVATEADLVAEDLPAGTYEVSIDYTVTGLSSAAGAASTEVTIKEAADGHAYKKLALEFKNSYNQDNYKEFTIKKGGSLTVTAPTGKISTATADYYQSQSCDVYAGDTEGAAITGVDGTATSNNKSKVKSYTIDNAVLVVDVPSSASYNQSFYTLTVTIVVE